MKESGAQTIAPIRLRKFLSTSCSNTANKVVANVFAKREKLMYFSLVSDSSIWPKKWVSMDELTMWTIIG